ncbi:MAG: hypothetical protein IJ960_04325 [Oscillospiraceae bacterium]|nr:hypothetical protein [Oscillospiraceae bacterium]
MNKRLTLILVLMLGMLLSGCQLAVDTVNEEGLISQDRLVGVVVTTESLDLFDMEGYLNDNLNAIMSGRNPDQSAYQGRLYAREELEEGTTDSGKAYTRKYYHFDNVEGMALIYYTAYTYLEDGTLLEEFTTGECGEGFWDVHFGTEETQGTIYLPEGGGDLVFYVNPVLQDSEGRLYVVTGGGIHSAEGTGRMSMYYNDEVKESIDGKEITRSRKFEVHFEWTEIPDTVVVLQMDRENQVIDRLECAPEELPEELTPMKDCAYVLLEQHIGETVTRQLLQKEDTSVTVYTRGDGNVCGGSVMNLRWEK